MKFDWQLQRETISPSPLWAAVYLFIYLWGDHRTNAGSYSIGWTDRTDRHAVFVSGFSEGESVELQWFLLPIPPLLFSQAFGGQLWDWSAVSCLFSLQQVQPGNTNICWMMYLSFGPQDPNKCPPPHSIIFVFIVVAFLSLSVLFLFSFFCSAQPFSRLWEMRR